MSLGHPPHESATTDPLVAAVARDGRGHRGGGLGRQPGINPATGQVGYGGISVPGNPPTALTVGAQTMGTPPATTHGRAQLARSVVVRRLREARRHAPDTRWPLAAPGSYLAGAPGADGLDLQPKRRSHMVDGHEHGGRRTSGTWRR